MIDPREAAATLEELAARYDVAAAQEWKGLLNPAVDATAALRDLAGRLREKGRSTTTHADAQFLDLQAAGIRSHNADLLTDDQVSVEWKASAQAGVALATRLEELGAWIRAGLQGRPTR